MHIIAGTRPIRVIAGLLLITVMIAGIAIAAKQRRSIQEDKKMQGWTTDTSKRTIELSELRSGGPGKDGIPAIDNPNFENITQAQKWLKPNEPVISVAIDADARAYPLQILMWHEIVNDRIANKPITVTFCPLCYSAIVFDGMINGQQYTFGVSGMLRNSDMVMYDRQTQSWWQQFTGQAIVGKMTGTILKQIPGQIIAFDQFISAYPSGKILSRKTGYARDYGRNPYVGYDNINSKPFLYNGKSDPRLRPMDKVVAIEVNDVFKAYPYSVTQEAGAINDEINGKAIVIFHSDGAVSALDKSRISDSRQAGSTGVFNRKVDGRKLTFTKADTGFVDNETRTTWDITGLAIAGQLRGKRLQSIASGDYFAFAWLVFRPETQIYNKDSNQ